MGARPQRRLSSRTVPTTRRRWLVQRVLAELSMDAELRTTPVPDQAAAEQAHFAGLPTSV
jgi:hypothetical protein